MKVSIITVAYNASSTIERTINSVKMQIYKNIEYIVVDGGSKDGTIDIINKYRDFVSTFISEPDAGIYDAMNKGLSISTGDIVAFLNADDMYAYDSVVSEVVNKFKDRNLDAVFGDLSYFECNKLDRIVRVYRSPSNVVEKLPFGVMPAHPTLFLAKNILLKFGYFNHEYKIAGDFDLIARIFKSNLIEYEKINKIMVKMQMGGVSTAGIKSTLQLNREIYKSCKSNAIKTNYVKLYSRYLSKLKEYCDLSIA